MGLIKLATWIIIILVVVGLGALTLNYLNDNKENSEQSGETQQQINSQNNIVNNNYLDEKPPRPPE